VFMAYHLMTQCQSRHSPADAAQHTAQGLSNQVPGRDHLQDLLREGLLGFEPELPWVCLPWSRGHQDTLPQWLRQIVHAASTGIDASACNRAFVWMH